MAIELSIAIATYRRPEMLRELIAEIAKVRTGAFEVLVGNDAVGDPVLAESLPKICGELLVFNRPKGLGQLANMNDLLSRARGRVFTWVNDDDLISATWIESVLERVGKCEQWIPAFCLFTEFVDRDDISRYLDQDAGQWKPISSTQFVHQFLEQKLKIIGCYGVFGTNELRNWGGLSNLSNTRAIYADHLLAVKTLEFPEVMLMNQEAVFLRTHPESFTTASVDSHLYLNSQISYFGECQKAFDQLDVPLRRQLGGSLLHYCLDHFLSVLFRGEQGFADSIGSFVEYWGRIQKFRVEWPSLSLMHAIVRWLKLWVHFRMRLR